MRSEIEKNYNKKIQMNHLDHNTWLHVLYENFDKQILPKEMEVNIDEPLYRCLPQKIDESSSSFHFHEEWLRFYPPLLTRQNAQNFRT